jgi:DNA-binding MarR family transcriptional regulator
MLQSEGMQTGAGLVDGITQAIGAVGGQSVLFSQAIANRLEIHPIDLECLGLLADHGSLTAGRLADLTGLTTGAVTRLIDRLERVGYVRRTADPTDRRRVIVELIPERMQLVAPHYEALQHGLETLLSSYTFEQRALILDFLRRSEAAMRAEVARLGQSRSGRAQRRGGGEDAAGGQQQQ